MPFGSAVIRNGREEVLCVKVGRWLVRVISFVKQLELLVLRVPLAIVGRLPGPIGEGDEEGDEAEAVALNHGD
ncbi:MAG: hypothetical protein CMP58_03625 [Flavobacteriales bacterium]|nr:hypothetical protein [Flavobacteriales bacterium]